MNAAGQRRLTPVLGVFCVLCVLLLGALVLGLGRGVHWNATGSSSALPTSGTVAPRSASPPLQHFADVWQEPLFNTERKPAPETDSGNDNVTLDNLQLTGIIITPNLRMALLHDRSGTDVRVHEGQVVADTGWTLVKLAPHSAVFKRNGQSIVLKLKVAGLGQAPAPAAPPARQGEGAALWMRTHAKGRQQQAPSKNAHETAGRREKEQRIQALKARIESRRRQLQAQRQREH